MSNEFALLGIGCISAAFYMTMGIGAARAVSKMNSNPIRLFHVFAWPVVLCVVASFGEVS